jgi:hypothetical protein
LGAFWGDLGTQHSVRPLSNHSVKYDNILEYGTDNASQFSSTSILNIEDDINHNTRTQNLGADLPDGPPEYVQNEFKLLEIGSDI